MPSHSDLDAVTVDSFGTMVELGNPVELLVRALEARGIACDRETVERAFATEAEYYVRHSIRGRDEASLEALRRDCVAVFLAAAEIDLDPDGFAADYIGSLDFRLIEGTVTALDALRSAGLRLACVGNWDASLESVLAELGVADRFHTIVSSATAGVEKPDAAIFRLALDRLGVEADRALHIGDSDADREGARAAGLAFEPVPLATLPERLGLEG